MRSRELGPCLVCGASAIGINFAVPTCAPCKAFFRRNAVKIGRVDFACHGDGDCPVTFKFRAICNCCRLAKCFRVGMQKSLIFTQSQRQARNDLVQQNRAKREQLAKKQNSHLIRPSTISLLTHYEAKDLQLSDQALLTSVFGAYKQTYTLSDGSEYPCFPCVERSSIHTLINEYEERHKLFIQYCKLIPEFNRLSIGDKKRLLQNYLVETLIIGNQILSKFVSKTMMTSLENIYEPTTANGIKQIFERLTAYIHDPILLKLILIIQILSNGFKRYDSDHKKTHIYDNPLAIFAGQNVYVELLWRYLLSRLSSERHAVKLFNRLVLDLLFLQQVSFVVERYVTRLGHEIEKMNPLMQSLWII